jgi:hypothetical protein
MKPLDVRRRERPYRPDSSDSSTGDQAWRQTMTMSYTTHRQVGPHRLGDNGHLLRCREPASVRTAMIASTFENVSDIGGCLGLSLGPSG